MTQQHAHAHAQEQLVSCARQIAIYRGYPDLENGLQALAVLIQKLAHEQEELEEAQASKSRLHAYHEAADVLYYAACLQAQGLAGRFDEGRAWLRKRGLDPAKAERCALAKYGWRSGGPNRKNEAYELCLLVPVLYRLVIFDLNGTLANTPFLDKEPLHLLPGRKQACEQLRQAGVQLAIATNQGGVAFGFVSEEAALAEVASIAKQIGARQYLVAFGHPQPKPGYEQYASPEHLAWRKPAPGMLLSLMESMHLTPADTLMVGDRSEDEQTAQKASIDFLWAQQFFGREETEDFS